MISWRLAVILALTTALTLIVTTMFVATIPKVHLTLPVIAWAFSSHAPPASRLFLIYWFGVPVAYAVGLATVPGLVWLLRSMYSANQQRLLRICVISGCVVTVANQAIRIGGVLLNRSQRAAFLAAGGAPSAYHFHGGQMILRISMLISALAMIWLGNLWPKLMQPLTPPGRQDRAYSARRIQGWAMVVAGLASAAVAFLPAFLMAVHVYLAIFGSWALIVMVVEIAYWLSPPSAPGGEPSR